MSKSRVYKKKMDGDTKINIENKISSKNVL